MIDEEMKEEDFRIETGVVNGKKVMFIFHKRRDITDCLNCIHNINGICSITNTSIFESHAELYNEKYDVCGWQAYYLPSGKLMNWRAMIEDE